MVKKLFLQYFPNPDKLKKGKESDPYGTLRAWFAGGNEISLFNDSPDKDFKKELDKVAGLKKLAETADAPKDEIYTFMELIIHGLAEFEMVNKEMLDTKISFKDLLADMFGDDDIFN